MKLATFVPAGGEEPFAGEVRDGEIVAFKSGTVVERVASGDLTPATGAAYPFADVTLLAPVPRPPAIFAIGRNYAAHAAELGNEVAERPIVFLKLPASSVPPAGPVIRPPIVTQLDYEAELVVVLGVDGRIAGWAVANDVSARDLQDTEPQWTRAKAFDTSCPWGPWITTVDELPDIADLRITSRVNGEIRQDGNTSDLVFGPETLVNFIGQTCALEPGSLILTGTPDGVGKAMEPPRFLASGDVVRIEIERLGAIEHRIEVR